MNITSHEPILKKKSVIDNTFVLVFNVEPLHGDVLESIHLSEMPKASKTWDTIQQKNNDIDSMEKESPRSSTLKYFSDKDLFSLGFGQKIGKMLMITIDEPPHILMPWTLWNKMSPPNQTIIKNSLTSPIENEIPFLDATGQRIRLPVSSLWKAKLRIHLSLPYHLAKKCKYNLITIVSCSNLKQNQIIPLAPPFRKNSSLQIIDNVLQFRHEIIQRIIDQC